MFQPWISSTATLFAVLTISSVLYFVYKMSERDYLGEFEHIVLLAVLRLGGQAYSVTVRREIEARNQARGFYRCRLCHPRPAGGKRLCTISRWPSNSGTGRTFSRYCPRRDRSQSHATRSPQPDRRARPSGELFMRANGSRGRCRTPPELGHWRTARQRATNCILSPITASLPPKKGRKCRPCVRYDVWSGPGT